MNDFGQQLTALLDDTAAGIVPSPNFGSVKTSQIRMHSRATDQSADRRLHRSIGIAAATLILFGGSAFAFEAATDGHESVASRKIVPAVTSLPSATIATTATSTAESGSVESGDRSTTRTPDAIEPVKPSISKASLPEPDGSEQTITEPPKDATYTARLGDADLGGTPMRQELFGTAAPGDVVTVTSAYGSATSTANDGGEWGVGLTMKAVPGGSKVLIRVTFTGSPMYFDFRLERPLPPPSSVEFTATPGSANLAGTPMKQAWYGSAAPGTIITASSEFGSAHATASSLGQWELLLKLYEVPGGSDVRILLSADTSENVYEFVLHRPEPEPQPQPAAFTVTLGSGRLGATPMKQVFYGTAAAGSVVRAQSEFGSAEAIASSKGSWEMALEMHEVPSGSDVGIRLTNSASESVFEFVLHRPETEPIDFTASAVFAECDSNPPFNEYWGKSTAGALISISSPYGGGQVTSGPDGKWAARIEFPEAPVGETFIVRITSSKGSAVYEFPLTRVGSV